MATSTGPTERFQDFLRTFQTETGEQKYRRTLGQLSLSGQRHIVVDFEDLIACDKDLAMQITDNPSELFPHIESAILAQLKIEDPQYAEKLKTVKVRFKNLPDHHTLRQVGSEHMGKLILIDGIIVRSTSVKSLLTKAAFQCKKCKNFTYLEQTGFVMEKPVICGRCRSPLLDFIEKQSTFINLQELGMQELPEDLPPGQIPRAMDITLTEDLIDAARPGDRVSVTGLVKAQQDKAGGRTPLRTFELLFDANCVEIRGKEETVDITPEEEEQIITLSKDPWIHRKLLASLAPSIYGYGDIKEGILYLLFGAVQKNLPDGTTRKGQVNILLIGDPGVAKSQLLQYVAHVAPRGIYTSGRGSSAAGLTAAVMRDKSGRMALEAGALVLADKGICAIDEIDKMRNEDRVAIHEALEQHTVCYDDKTEILTKEGWKLFKYLHPKDEAAVLNNQGYLKYEVPTRIIARDYTGPMIKVKGSKKVDLVVTPPHELYCAVNRGANSWTRFHRVEAQKIFGHRVKFKRDAKWHGKEQKHFVLPCFQDRSRKLISMDVWLEFFGYWLSEGHAEKYRVTITQRKDPAKIAKIERCLNRMPFKHSHYPSAGNFVIHDKQLAAYLSPFGHAADKFIPTDLKELSTRQLCILQEALMLEDGYKRTDHNTIQSAYCTTSNRLASDVQELLLKTGLSGNIRVGHRKGRPSGHGVARFDNLEVSIVYKNEPQVGCCTKKGRKAASWATVDYSGRIHCVEVGPPHIVYVRRNGVPVWSGNSIAKGGIVTTLNARTSVLAAANPAMGRYNLSQLVTENINLPITILSRFDLIFIMKDLPDPEMDTRLTRHVLTLHRTQSFTEKPPIGPELFRKYIAYAHRIMPVLTQEASDEIEAFYLKMRGTSTAESPIAITPRQLESLVRLSECRARSFLRPDVTAEDARYAIRLMTYSLKDVGIDTATGKQDIDVIMTGQPKSMRDKMQIVRDTIAEIEKTDDIVEERKLYDALAKKNMLETEATRLIEQLTRDGIIYNPRPGYIKRTAG